MIGTHISEMRRNGTCHIVIKDDREMYGEAYFLWFECDECGAVYPYEYIDSHRMPKFRFCPNCGRRVV